MKTALIRGHGGAGVIEFGDLPEPKRRHGEVLVRVRAASLNHLDLWVAKGGRVKLEFPHVMGSDMCGVVEESSTDRFQKGDRVVLNPGLWCGHCPRCVAGEESECESYTITGLGAAGVFAELASVRSAALSPAPEHLSEEEAATMGIASLTAWRMLFSRARLRPGERLLIHGIGGGVALFALRFAVAAGAKVAVTSSSDEKLSRARELGASVGVRYNEREPAEELLRLMPGGFDVILDTAGAATLPLSFAAARKGARIVTCGITAGAEASLSVQQLYWKSLSYLGSTMGSRRDFSEMLRFVSLHKIRPVIDRVFPLSEVQEAEKRMESGKQFGKIILRVS